MTKNLELAQFGGKVTYDDLNEIISFGTDVAIAGIATATTLYATNGTFSAGIDTGTDVGFILEEEGSIYTRDAGLYLRNLIQKKSDNIIIGQQGTILINGIELKPGDAGSVKLHHGGTNDNVKLQTTTSGIEVTGTTDTDQLNVTGVSTFQGNVYFGDEDRLRFGDDNDLQIYHASGGDSRILETGSGNLNIDANNLRIRNAGSSEVKAQFSTDGAVELYYDGSKKLETTSDGVTVSGGLNASGISTITSTTGGTVLDVVSNVDAGYKHTLKVRSAYDRDAGIEIGHLSSKWNIWIDGNGDDALQFTDNSGNLNLELNKNGSTDLFYNNSKKLETTDYGIYVTGAGNTSTIGGAANLVLDPLTVGDNTGTVTILGDLQVEGTQTIINSTTLEVDDKLVSIAKSATNASQADGAGLEINGASAKLTYASTGDKWVFNKAPYYNTARILTTDDEGLGNGLDADTLAGISSDSFLRSDADDIFTGLLTQVPGAFARNVSYGGTDFTAAIRIASTSMRGGIVVSNQNNFRALGEHASFMHYDGFNTAADCYAFRARIGTTLTDTFYVTGQGKGYFAGNVGIGTDNPLEKLHVKGGNVIVENTAPIDTGPYINFVETGYNDRFGILAEMSGSGDANRLIITANNSGNSPAAGDHLMVIEQGGRIGIGVSEPTHKLDINANSFRVRSSKTPATAGAAGTTGEIAWDTNYIYVCTATNTWKRAALSTW